MLSRTGGVAGLSGSDIVLSGPTEGEYWDEQYQHSHIMQLEQLTPMKKCRDKDYVHDIIANIDDIDIRAAKEPYISAKS